MRRGDSLYPILGIKVSNFGPEGVQVPLDHRGRNVFLADRASVVVFQLGARSYNLLAPPSAQILIKAAGNGKIG